MTKQLEPTSNESGFLLAMAYATGHVEGFDPVRTRAVLRVFHSYRDSLRTERKTESQRTQRAKAKAAKAG